MHFFLMISFYCLEFGLNSFPGASASCFPHGRVERGAEPGWCGHTEHQWHELAGLSCKGKTLKTVYGEGAGLPATSIAR